VRRDPPTEQAPSFVLEQELVGQGYRAIAGVDEVGRGSLAGPLCLGLVIFGLSTIAEPPSLFAGCINDSKKISPRARHRALDVIGRHALFHGYFMVSHRVVDRLSINGATEFALIRMLEVIPVKPDIIIMDGKFNFQCPVPLKTVIRGDSRTYSIASASIVAKIQRDEVLRRLDTRYPGYGLACNKGYGTLAHREAIARLGPSAIHRKSYEPVKSLVSQGGLFGYESRS